MKISSAVAAFLLLLTPLQTIADTSEPNKPAELRDFLTIIDGSLSGSTGSTLAGWNSLRRLLQNVCTFEDTLTAHDDGLYPFELRGTCNLALNGKPIYSLDESVDMPFKEPFQSSISLLGPHAGVTTIQLTSGNQSKATIRPVFNFAKTPFNFTPDQCQGCDPLDPNSVRTKYFDTPHGHMISVNIDGGSGGNTVYTTFTYQRPGGDNQQSASASTAQLQPADDGVTWALQTDVDKLTDAKIATAMATFEADDKSNGLLVEFRCDPTRERRLSATVTGYEPQKDNAPLAFKSKTVWTPEANAFVTSVLARYRVDDQPVSITIDSDLEYTNVFSLRPMFILAMGPDGNPGNQLRWLMERKRIRVEMEFDNGTKQTIDFSPQSPMLHQYLMACQIAAN